MSYTNQAYVNTLEDLDSHDCHLSPEDGCDCIVVGGRLMPIERYDQLASDVPQEAYAE